MDTHAHESCAVCSLVSGCFHSAGHFRGISQAAFLSVAEYSIVWVDPVLFIHSSVDAHFFDTAIHAAVNIHVRPLGGHLFSILRVGLRGP